MARYRGTIASPRSAEDVFDYMAMFSNVSEWDPTAAEAHPIDGNKPGHGARFHVLVRWLGREIPLEYTTTVYERPNLLVLRAENASTISEDTITVESIGTGSQLTYEARVTIKGVMRFIDPVFSLLFRRLGDNAAAGLRRQLSGDPE